MIVIDVLNECIDNVNSIVTEFDLSLPVFNYPFSLPSNLTIDMLCNDNLAEYLPLKCGLSISEALIESGEEKSNLTLDVKPL